MTRVILQLGSDNWQRDDEPAPDSGILHELQHRALNRQTETHAYSLYPSRCEGGTDPLVKVLRLDHDIPVFESVSPTSANRWHSMSDDDLGTYLARLTVETESWIDEIEARHGVAPALAIAHHAFVHPIVLADINERRIAAGRQRIPVVCFVHGAAVRMHQLESTGERPVEFPTRFVSMMHDEGVFGSGGPRCVDRVAACTTEQIDHFRSIFPQFPFDRLVITPQAYDATVFRPEQVPARVRAWRGEVLGDLLTAPVPGSDRDAEAVPGDYDHYVVFSGTFRASKRLDALLHAAALWQRDSRLRIATLVIGTAPEPFATHYHDLAHRQLKLRHTYFLGPQSPSARARLFTAADVVCVPARDELQGQSLIEAMACGTPVVGAHSGAPREFVNDDTGLLVLESDDTQVLASRLAAAITQALRENWKVSRGSYAMRYAEVNFSIEHHLERLLDTKAREPIPV